MKCEGMRLCLAATLALLFLGSLILVLDRAAARGPSDLGGELPGDTVLRPADNPHVVAGDLIVPIGVALTVEPGVELRFAPETSLLVYGRLHAIGSFTQPITFSGRDEGVYWGAIAILDSRADNQLRHAVIEGIGEEPGATPRHYGITVRGGRLTVADSLIRYTGSPGVMVEDDATFSLLNSEIHHTRGDALHAIGGKLVIQGNHIHDIAWEEHNYEGLSLNEISPERPALVTDNHIHHVSDDCVDLNHTTATVTRNQLGHCGDKGLSIGALQGGNPLTSSVTAANNLIYSNTLGIAVKDSAALRLVNNTIVGNRDAGLALYEDHQGLGGGHARVVNTILWGNGTAITLDQASTLSVTFSDVAGGWPGQGNLNENPLFAPAGDYRLTLDSPCRDAGSPDDAPTDDLDGQSRPIGPAPDVGAYEFPSLHLTARPGDENIYLRWQIGISPTLGSSYAIHYSAHPGPGSVQWSGYITGLPTTTLRYTLTGLTNNVWYTVAVALQDAVGADRLRSNAVAVMPAAPRVYLPLVILQRPPKPALYQMAIDPADLAWLDDNLSNRELVPAQFVHEGFVYDASARYRGEIARYLPKKSWKVHFGSSQLFDGQREVNLNAEYPDKSLLRDWLGYDLFQRAGLVAPRASFARLYVNGEYRGLFTQVEQVDQRFLDRAGLDPNGNLYKGDYGSFQKADSPEAYAEQYLKRTNREDSHDDIIAFVELINDTPVDGLPAALAEVMDVGVYLDWYAVQTLIGNYEWVEKNYYVYHDLQADRWLFIPWDLDLSFGHNHTGTVFDQDISWDNPIDAGTDDSQKWDGKWNKLTSAVLGAGEFRAAYCRRLRELMDDAFSVEVMSQRIDLAYQMIRPYGEADPHKWGDNPDFNAGPDELETYVAKRRDWLLAQMPGYCPSDGPLPLINEVMSHNTHTLADEAGEFEPWIELYNPSLVSFDTGGMRIGDGTTQWTIPGGTVLAPGGFALIWADGEPGEGARHANFRLTASGGQLYLLDKPVHGGGTVDQFDYGRLSPDASLGRQDDGGDDLVVFAAATPGWSNRGHTPHIGDVRRSPAEPGAGQTVTVTAAVSAARELSAVWLHYDAGAGETVISMTPIVIGGNAHYSASLPALVAGTAVRYHVRAEDNVGLTARVPPRGDYRYRVAFSRPPLFINELVAINTDGHQDEAGESDDWFEIYNAGLQDVDLGGMYLTDSIKNTTKWQIPAGVVAPGGGHVVFWADGAPEQGSAHVAFKLDGDGGRLALYAGAEGYNELIDEVYYRPQSADQSTARYPDGTGEWRAQSVATPGEANRQPAPIIGDVTRTPRTPLVGQSVTITAKIADDGTVLTASLYYDAGGGWEVLAMTPAAGGLYTAQIPPQPEGTQMTYYVEALDDLGEMGRDPSGAPGVLYGYRVGQVVALFINELMADNKNTLADETGKYEDWIELYNGGTITVEVGGLYLSDDLGKPTRWQIPSGGLIPPGGFLLIWADDDPQDGPLHATFKLSKNGEAVGLFQRCGVAYCLLDGVTFGQQAMDASLGRATDGGLTWQTFANPTPGAAN